MRPAGKTFPANRDLSRETATRYHSRWKPNNPPPSEQGAFVPMRLKPNLNVKVFESCPFLCFGTRRLEKSVCLRHIRNDPERTGGDQPRVLARWSPRFKFR